MQLTGNIEDLGIGEIFQILNFSGKSGVLRLHNAKMEGSIVFRDGLLIKATSSALREGVGEALVKDGVITQDDLDRAKEGQKKGAYACTVGSLLASGKKADREKLDDAAVRLIEKAIFPFFFWQDGYFVFELCDYAETPDIIKADPLQYVLDKGLNPQFLAMEGIRLRDESRDRAEEEPASPVETVQLQQSGQGKGEGPETATREAAAAESAQDVRYYLQDLLSEIGEDGYFPKDSGDALLSVPNSKGIMVLKEMLEELARPMSLNEIVLMVLRFSSEIVNRSVLFCVRNGHLVGSGQFGIEIKGESPDNRVRKMRVPVGAPSILNEAVEKKRVVIKETEGTEWDSYLVEQLGGLKPHLAFAAPIMLKGKVEMVLYGDNVPENRGLDDISALEIFLGQANMAMERKY